MGIEFSEYQLLLRDRFLAQVDEDEKVLMIGLALGPEQYGVEDEMLQYLKCHPGASFQEVDEYFYSIIPPLEIVDDDLLDDEDE
ncbi:MAG: hypothetical protein KH009_03545 [Clostridiales bacterium]|nr:hypothetical protein [Clostridiales bacterium]